MPAYREGKPPERGAIWLTYFPHHGIRTVIGVHAATAEPHPKTLNMVEFGHSLRKSSLAGARACPFCSSKAAASMENLHRGHDEIGERMTQAVGHLPVGAATIVRSALPEPMEDGMQQHFHERYCKTTEPLIAEGGCGGFFVRAP